MLRVAYNPFVVCLNNGQTYIDRKFHFQKYQQCMLVYATKTILYIIRNESRHPPSPHTRTFSFSVCIEPLLRTAGLRQSAQPHACKPSAHTQFMHVCNCWIIYDRTHMRATRHTPAYVCRPTHHREHAPRVRLQSKRPASNRCARARLQNVFLVAETAAAATAAATGGKCVLLTCALVELPNLLSANESHMQYICDDDDGRDSRARSFRHSVHATAPPAHKPMLLMCMCVCVSRGHSDRQIWVTFSSIVADEHVRGTRVLDSQHKRGICRPQ